MSLLFTVENKAVIPYPETLLISPFKEIWERDKTKDKRYATEEFTYIEFSTSQKESNPYKGYGEVKKEAKLLEDIITKKDWKADKLVKEGMKKVVEFQKEASVNYTLLMSCRKAVEELKNFFETVDLTEVNERTGSPKYKPKEITSALNDVNNLTTNLDSLEKKVGQDLYEVSKTKGQKIISPFAQELLI